MILRVLPVLAAMAFVALAVPVAAAPTNVLAPGASAAGRVRAPALHAERLEGPDPIDLDRLYGRVVVLDFWATWCGPCHRIMPVLEQLHRDRRDDGLSIIGISNEPAPPIRAFLSARPVSYTVGRDLGGTHQRYGVRGLPTLVVIGRDGKVRAVQSGADPSRLSALRTLVDELLAERPPEG